jgi:PKD repeat protein
VKIEGPESGKVNETLAFSVSSAIDGVLPLDCYWDFGDGVTAQGARVKHAYTLTGTYAARVTVEGLDGLPAEKKFSIKVAGFEQPGPPVPYIEKNEPANDK